MVNTAVIGYKTFSVFDILINNPAKEYISVNTNASQYRSTKPTQIYQNIFIQIDFAQEVSPSRFNSSIY
ncbi:hypothetical protein [Anaerosalibacter sp. Marseille-P3206]|uniref:hypothetical protein n=1 Tax=Anaerosalibacter sp. Marseille-P3206 TaxID=1871005 RepID=UPI00135633B6|nr:hypothetical protein [Anaerosalibacter sp. Marseille-P3206]